MADGREVQLTDEHLAPPPGQGQPGGKRRQRDRDRGRDRGRAGRRAQQLADLLPKAREQRQPGRIPDRGPLLVPVLPVSGQGGSAAAGKRTERAGVEVDVALEERKFGPQGSPISHRTRLPQPLRRCPSGAAPPALRATSPQVGRSHLPMNGEDITHMWWYSARKSSARRPVASPCLSAPEEG